MYLGMSLYQKNDKEHAIQELRKAIELNKTSNSVRKAENYLDAIISGRSIGVDSLHQVIKDQLNGNNYSGAAQTASLYLHTHPEDALAWDQIATAYCWLHKFDSSLYCGEKAIALDSGQTVISCEAHYHNAICQYMKNSLDAALAEFAAAINERTGDKLKKKVKHAQMQMGLDEQFAHWKTIETDNLVFHFQNKKHLDDADALMEKYIAEYNKTVRVLPTKLPKKIDLFVWEHDSSARVALQNDKEVGYTNTDFCVIHVAPDNYRSSDIMHILGNWQKAH